MKILESGDGQKARYLRDIVLYERRSHGGSVTRTHAAQGYQPRDTGDWNPILAHYRELHASWSKLQGCCCSNQLRDDVYYCGWRKPAKRGLKGDPARRCHRATGPDGRNQDRRMRGDET
jgi:hypothetical protein